MSRAVLVYRLSPAKAERELFQSLIKVLAQELDAPLFEPHLTLFSVSPKAGSANSVLKQTKAEPLKLRVRDVQFSPQFTKTSLVRFVRFAALDRLDATLQRKSGARLSPVKDPHLSLCYKKLPAATKKRLAAMIQLPVREVVFDTLTAVRCTMPTDR